MILKGRFLNAYAAGLTKGDLDEHSVPNYAPNPHLAEEYPVNTCVVIKTFTDHYARVDGHRMQTNELILIIEQGGGQKITLSVSATIVEKVLPR